MNTQYKRTILDLIPAVFVSPGVAIPQVSAFFLKNFLFLMFIFETVPSGGGAEREGDTESETGSRLWAVSTEPDAGLELTDREIMTWAEVGCLTNWATQVPLDLTFWIQFDNLCFKEYFKEYMFMHKEKMLKIFYLKFHRTITCFCRKSCGCFHSFIYFERGKEQGRGRERKNPKQVLQFQHRAWCGARTHKLWDHDLSQNQELGA